MNIQTYNQQIINGFLEKNSERKANSYKALKSDCNSLMSFLSDSNVLISIMADQSNTDKYILYLKSLKTADRTVKRRICTLRSLLKYCADQGLITDQKIELEDKVKKVSTDILSEEKIRKIFNYCINIFDTDSYAIARTKMSVLLVVICGFKSSELCNIKLNDISHFEISYLDYQNNKRIRFVDMTEFEKPYAAYLSHRKNYLDNNKSEYLFIDRFYKQCTAQTLNTDIRLFCEKVNLNVTHSMLRNACIKHYYDNIPDYILISKIFDVSADYIRKLISYESD